MRMTLSIFSDSIVIVVCFLIKYRDILRLHSQGLSKRSIAASYGCSRNTITSALESAAVVIFLGLYQRDVTDGDLHGFLFPERSNTQNHRMPDYDYIHKELVKKGVTLTLLWEEYCKTCFQNGKAPYMYTQFCYHYRKFANTTKVTLSIKRKPGELLEVDWAGQTALSSRQYNWRKNLCLYFCLNTSL
jgi:transposase